MRASDSYDILIVGGGFFGCALALYLRRQFDARVLVVEMADKLMTRASYVNQARVHNGYHYPRSILTALRSRVNMPQFVRDFERCINDRFDAYYAISSGFTHVTAAQFRLFCERIGAPISRAPEKVRGLFSSELIEDVFTVREYAFDSSILHDLILQQLEDERVEVRLNHEALAVARAPGGRLEVTCKAGEDTTSVTAQHVFNCTYAHINSLLANSGLSPIYLKHELTEIALVEPPPELADIGVTVMCGPFFSIMPFPARGLHSLTHVRYTPHTYWHDVEGETYQDGYRRMASLERSSNFLRMSMDARRYLPCVADASYVESLWEVKTVLPVSEFDDSRPILFSRNRELENLTCIMGGKIDNIYDMIESVESLKLIRQYEGSVQ